MAAVTLFRGAGFAGRGCGSARCRHGYISDRPRLAAAEWHPECHAGDKELVQAGAHRTFYCITTICHVGESIGEIHADRPGIVIQVHYGRFRASCS
jgi:hypothetical protein